ncbi:unnamed protein product [Parajaminaea phylloscopi]
MISTSLALGALAAVVAVNGQNTEGNPSAATGQTFNQPTKSWQPWQPKASYAYSALPDQYMGPNRGRPLENGWSWSQSGYNRCLQGEGSWNSKANCQTAWINSAEDFCVWGPPEPNTPVANFERIAVAYCTQPTHGTRLIPEGTLTGVHFVKTADYVQVTGLGDFTKIGLPFGDSGGEMDNHGEDDLMNPIGGVIYTTQRPGRIGQPTQLMEWTNFMSYNQFCIRGCWGERAGAQCQHRYDIMGCAWNIPANYGEGFESCEGDIAMIQGVYGGSTFNQGDGNTPAPHPAPSSSRCSTLSSIGNGGVLLANGAVKSSSTSSATSAASSTGGTSATARATSASGANAAAASGSSSGASAGASVSAIVISFAAAGAALFGGALLF